MDPCYFQDDNARCHVSRATIKWNADDNSLDLNPTEHLWDELDRRVRARQARPKSIAHLTEWWQEEWRRIPVDVLQTNVESMPNWVAAVIAARVEIRCSSETSTCRLMVGKTRCSRLSDDETVHPSHLLYCRDLTGQVQHAWVLGARGGIVGKLLASRQSKPASVLARVAPGLSRVRFIPDDAAGWRLLRTHLASPSSALKISTLRAAQISPFHFTPQAVDISCYPDPDNVCTAAGASLSRFWNLVVSMMRGDQNLRVIPREQDANQLYCSTLTQHYCFLLTIDSQLNGGVSKQLSSNHEERGKDQVFEVYLATEEIREILGALLMNHGGVDTLTTAETTIFWLQWRRKLRVDLALFVPETRSYKVMPRLNGRCLDAQRQTHLRGLVFPRGLVKEQAAAWSYRDHCVSVNNQATRLDLGEIFRLAPISACYCFGVARCAAKKCSLSPEIPTSRRGPPPRPPRTCGAYSRPKTQSPVPKSKTQNPIPKTQDSRLKTLDPRLKTQDSRPLTQGPITRNFFVNGYIHLEVASRASAILSVAAPWVQQKIRTRSITVSSMPMGTRTVIPGARPLRRGLDCNLHGSRNANREWLVAIRHKEMSYIRQDKSLEQYCNTTSTKPRLLPVVLQYLSGIDLFAARPVAASRGSGNYPSTTPFPEFSLNRAWHTEKRKTMKGNWGSYPVTAFSCGDLWGPWEAKFMMTDSRIQHGSSELNAEIQSAEGQGSASHKKIITVICGRMRGGTPFEIRSTLHGLRSPDLHSSVPTSRAGQRVLPTMSCSGSNVRITCEKKFSMPLATARRRSSSSHRFCHVFQENPTAAYLISDSYDIRGCPHTPSPTTSAIYLRTISGVYIENNVRCLLQHLHQHQASNTTSTSTSGIHYNIYINIRHPLQYLHQNQASTTTSKSTSTSMPGIYYNGNRPLHDLALQYRLYRRIHLSPHQFAPGTLITRSQLTLLCRGLLQCGCVVKEPLVSPPLAAYRSLGNTSSCLLVSGTRRSNGESHSLTDLPTGQTLVMLISLQTSYTAVIASLSSQPTRCVLGEQSSHISYTHASVRQSRPSVSHFTIPMLAVRRLHLPQITLGSTQRRADSSLRSLHTPFPWGGGDYVAARPRSRSEGAIRATITRTHSASSFIRARSRAILQAPNSRTIYSEVRRTLDSLGGPIWKISRTPSITERGKGVEPGHSFKDNRGYSIR
ncbi:hypothetical protein PR048_017880 [Dryococelus australis]|uniref:Uncharacterized protein n=1 Tax=Dryococelus australis TaxID=614101 RepID=A0ABQ9HAU3_9NEOP|nr:hypothetical protein PR048_017880 [Dryococelus australis]